MRKLRIYDSQGSPIRGEGGSVNQQIKQFFFDGVRFAVDKNQGQLYCFFRARDNETARSEQYYALYDYSSRSELKDLVSAVETRIEGEYGMVLDLNKDDTRFFELLSGQNPISAPGDRNTIRDITELLSEYHQARVGVGSYEKAHALFSEFFTNNELSTIAVSENASGTSVSSYDLVVEKGNHTGLEPLGDTADAIEELREERRSTFETFEEQDEDDLLSLSSVPWGIVIAGVGVLILIGSIYAGCLVQGTNTPIIGSPPGVEYCGEQPGRLQDVSAEVTGNNSQQLQIQGNVSNPSRSKGEFTVEMNKTSSEEVHTRITNESVDDGSFSFSVAIENLSNGEYSVTVRYANSSGTAEFELPPADSTPSSTPASTETDTPTPPQTDAETATDTAA